ncbi:MNIO family bufferin maturase [Pelagibius marinus]|uniref:MNIO family bufferin maturase n=1 Tax=Pelagibius marinus TaxID=2762760 RepID=UPI001872B41F|nr:DUF692 domain-containing protein [Pelagibius marinus]
MTFPRNFHTVFPRCGIGLRAAHLAEVMATRPDIAWVEVHAENYMGGGKALRDLERIRESYAVSLHGVGLSLGSVERPDVKHLQRLRDLIGLIEPCLVSEHLAWSSFGGVYLNDLLPIPYTRESLDIVARNVTIAQDFLQRPILIENPSAYLTLSASTIPEAEFLGLLARRSGCGLLCDVNNVQVTCANTAGNPCDWLDALPAQAVGEIHLAGHAVNPAGGRVVLIDDHGSPVAESVWALYGHAVARFPQAPALLEWDNRLPALARLLEEAALADARHAAALGSPCNAAA